MPRNQAIPERLDGKSVLDIGGYDGSFARLCLERGAASATVVDNGEWRQYGWQEPERPEGGRYVNSDFLEYDEPADFVIFYNVLYHCKDPFTALAKVRSLTRHEAVICTSFVDQGDASGWRWYPDGMGHSNGTVWVRPTPEALRAGLHAAGFTAIEEIGRWGDHIVVRCT